MCVLTYADAPVCLLGKDTDWITNTCRSTSLQPLLFTSLIIHCCVFCRNDLSAQWRQQTQSVLLTRQWSTDVDSVLSDVNMHRLNTDCHQQCAFSRLWQRIRRKLRHMEKVFTHYFMCTTSCRASWLQDFICHCVWWISWVHNSVLFTASDLGIHSYML